MLWNYLIQLTVTAILQERGHRLDQGLAYCVIQPSPREGSSFGLAPAIILNTPYLRSSIDYKDH